MSGDLGLLIPLCQYLPLKTALVACTQSRICKSPGFWTSWFYHNGVRLPTRFSDLSFHEIVDELKAGLLNRDPTLIPVFQAFLSNPRLIFPGVEYFIGIYQTLVHALALEDEEMVTHCVTLINNSFNISQFDYLVVDTLVSYSRVEVLRSLETYKLNIWRLHELISGNFSHLVSHLMNRSMGLFGSIGMFELVQSRFSPFYDADIINTRILASYFGNMDLATQLERFIPPEYHGVIHEDLKWLDLGAPDPIDEVSFVKQILYSYHIGDQGLYSALDRIISHDRDYPRNALKPDIAVIVQIAMNRNDVEFLSKIFGSSWFNSRNLWRHSGVPHVAVVFADTETWDLVIANSSYLQGLLTSGRASDEITPMSDVWIGNRFDVILHLRSRFGPIKQHNDYIPGTNLIRDLSLRET